MTDKEFKDVFDGTPRYDARNKVDLAVNDLEGMVDTYVDDPEIADDFYRDIVFLGHIASRILDLEEVPKD